MFIDVTSGEIATGEGIRVCLNAEHADTAERFETDTGNPIVRGTANKPIYLNNMGQPTECDDILAVDISGCMVDENGNARTIGTASIPVYFDQGIPTECDEVLDVDISGHAATAEISGSAYRLLNDRNQDLEAGDEITPVYFAGGVPVPCDSIKLEPIGNTYTPFYIDSQGDSQECVEFLPLSAGVNKKISGSLGLTSGINYGASFPLDDNFEGKLFFIEDKEEDNMLYLPPGGSSGQVLIKYSSVDGDAYWGNLSSDYLSLTGGTLTGNLTAPCYITKNYGYADPNTSGATTAEGKPIQGTGINGALYFKIIS